MTWKLQQKKERRDNAISLNVPATLGPHQGPWVVIGYSYRDGVHVGKYLTVEPEG